MNRIQLIVSASFIALFIGACTPQVSLPMPTKVKDYSGYANGNGIAAEFKIRNNGNIMIYTDSAIGTVMLSRDKNAPIFRGKYTDGINVSSSTSGSAYAYGNVGYGNSNTYTSSSSQVRNIKIIYGYGTDKMTLYNPKYSLADIDMTVSSNTKQDFSSWYKEVEEAAKAYKK